MNFKVFEMNGEEFSVVLRNLDLWEKMNNVKFVEAEVGEEGIKVKALKVATPSFFIYSEKDGYSLMVELISDSRIGYVNLEEFAELDEEILEELVSQVLKENLCLNNRYFPKSKDSLKIFKKLIKNAKWKKPPFGYSEQVDCNHCRNDNSNV